MNISLRHITLSALVAVAVSASAETPTFMHAYDPWAIEAAAPEVESMGGEEITIKTEGRKIHVNGAEGETLEVFNVTGVKVAAYTIDAPEKTITLTMARGVYIVRVGKVARKVNLL